jgi:hypothetical protein
MKKIAIFIAIFCFSASAQAWLFEYHLGVQTPTNSTGGGNDVVEQLQTPTGSTYARSTHNSNYYSNSHYNYSDSCTDWTLGNRRPSCDYSIWYHSDQGSFYKKQDLINRLEDELDIIEDELDYIDDRMRELRADIRTAKRYITHYYKNLREHLEDELDFLEDKKDEWEDREDDIKDEIRKVRNMHSTSRSYYYDYYGTNYTYNAHNYRYDDSSYYNNRNYYRYDYDSGTYIPHWVNPDLKSVNDGHIYIR